MTLSSDLNNCQRARNYFFRYYVGPDQCPQLSCIHELIERVRYFSLTQIVCNGTTVSKHAIRDQIRFIGLLNSINALLIVFAMAFLSGTLAGEEISAACFIFSDADYRQDFVSWLTIY